MGTPRWACWHVLRVAITHRHNGNGFSKYFVMLEQGGDGGARARALAHDERKRDAQPEKMTRDSTTTTDTDSLTDSEATRTRARRHERAAESTTKAERSLPARWKRENEWRRGGGERLSGGRSSRAFPSVLGRSGYRPLGFPLPAAFGWYTLANRAALRIPRFSDTLPRRCSADDSTLFNYAHARPCVRAHS